VKGGIITTLADVCKSVRYGYTASACQDVCGPRFVRITDIVPDSIDWESVPYCKIDESVKERYALDVGDIVVARTGATVGYAKLIRKPVDAVYASYLVRFRVDTTIANPGFIGSLVESNLYRSFVQSRIGGAAQPNASAPVLGSFEFRLPSSYAQARIADILSAYDDLIENNRRRMVLLEEAARQLYREWFVRLRFPGHEHTRVIKGVPVGWQNEKVGNLLAKIESKKKIPKDSYVTEGPIPCVDQSAEFIGGFTDDEDAVYSQPLPVIVFGDHTRALKFVNFAFARGAEGTQIIYPNTEQISSEYMYLALREIDLSNYFYARHFKFLKEKEVFLPEPSLIREFTVFARSCFEQIQTMRLQTQKLRTARDLLLPRLMNDEINV
jgi:type I restriction enzyme S subunit